MKYLYLAITFIFIVYICYKYILSSKKVLSYSLIGLVIASVLLIVLLDVFTLEPRPNGAVSGNGNLGLVVLFPFVPILFVFLILWGKGIYRGLAGAGQAVIKRMFIASLSGVVMGGVLQIYYVQTKLHQLKGFPYHPFEGERTGILNQYTNTLFVNTYTYGLLVFVVFIGVLLIAKHNKTS